MSPKNPFHRAEFKNELLNFRAIPQNTQWVSVPEWVKFMHVAAKHLHNVFPRQSGYLFAMCLLHNLSVDPVHQLSPYQLRLYVDNLWTHLVPGVPWLWSSLFQEILFEKRKTSAPEFLEQLLDASERDPRNPNRHDTCLSWQYAMFTHRGNAKNTMADHVMIRSVGEVHLCLVADGISRSTVGSGEDAIHVLQSVVDAHATRMDTALQALDVTEDMETWVGRVKAFQLNFAQLLNAELIAAIRRRHPEKLLPSDDIMSLACTILVLRRDVAVLAQCGDSGAFLFDANCLVPLTREHSVRYENILARLYGRPTLVGPPGALTHLLPQAVNTSGVQVLVPSVGDLFSFSFVRLSAESRLLVSTDGMIPRNPHKREYIARELRLCSQDMSPQEQAQRLADRALETMWSDNLGFALWIPKLDPRICVS